MNRTNEITLLPNPAHHTLDHNGYIKDAIIIIDDFDESTVFIIFNKEYFN